MKVAAIWFISLIMFSLKTNAQSPVINRPEIIDKIGRSLLHLEKSQQKETSGTDYFAGEWPSYLSNEARILFIGKKGKRAYDSNCFTTSLIHNILAETYLSNPQWTNIPPMLDLAIDNIKLFRHKDTFKFWHVLDRPEYISRAKHLKNPEKYRQSRPNNFMYKSRFINSYANVYDDADDTAAAYAALLLNHEVHRVLGDSTIRPDSIGYLFSANRDINRRNLNWYNIFYGISSRTNAYLTWFGEEKLATPWRWFTPKGNQPNMPFGANDVCPVVNANILKTLALYGEQDTDGVINACDLISRLMNKKNNTSYTVYYPTEYNLEYVVSGGIKAGVHCHSINTDDIVSHVMVSQNSNGSWSSEIKNNDLQATLYAVNALLKIGNIERHQSLANIEKGITYVLENEIMDDETSFWKGGIFFSGGTIMKKTHVWRSDAYTTALVVEMLNNYLLLDMRKQQIVKRQP